MLLIWEAAPSKYEVVKFDGVRSFTVEGISEVTQHPLENGTSATDHVFAKPKTITMDGLVTNTPRATGTDPSIAARYPGAVIVPTPGAEVMSESATALELPDSPGKFPSQTVKLNLPPKPLKIGNPVGQAIGLIRDQFSTANNDKATLGVGARDQPKASAQLVGATSYRDRVKETYDALELARTQARFVRVETGRVGDLDNMLITGVTFRREDGGTKGVINLSLTSALIVNALTVEAPQPAEPMGQQKKAGGSKSAKPDDVKKDEAKKQSLAKAAAKAGAQLLRDFFE